MIYKELLSFFCIVQKGSIRWEGSWLNTTQLECFLAVADCLNFSRAAEQLRITQPAVSHQIRTLEDELGVQLFSRTSKTVRLTQEGHMFLQYAGEILKLTGISKARVKQSHTGQAARLEIGYRSASDLSLIRPALDRLRQETPHIMPLLRFFPFSGLDNLLAEGEIQMMFTFQENTPKNSVYRELVRCPVVCVCRADHPLAHREQVTLETLKGAGRIAACRPPACTNSLFAIQGQLVTAGGPDHVIFCETQEALFAMVDTGYAFAVIADFPQLHQPGLCYLPLPEFPALSFGAAYSSGNRSPALRTFLRLLEKTLCPEEGKHP